MLPSMAQPPDAHAAVADCARRLSDRDCELTELMERSYFQGMAALIPRLVEELASTVAEDRRESVARFVSSVRHCDRGLVSAVRARTVEKFAAVRADLFRLPIPGGATLYAPSAHEASLVFAEWAAARVRDHPQQAAAVRLVDPVPELRAAIEWERHRVRTLYPLPAAPGANDDLRPRCDGALMCSTGFDTVVSAADVFTLNEAQARAFRLLVEANERGGRWVRHGDLRKAAGTGAACIRDVFRGNGKPVPIWKKRLITPVQGKKWYYVLNLGEASAAPRHRSAG